MAPTKCEFCDLTLNSDLEVSRHLASKKHADELKNFVDLHPRDDEIVQRDAPRKMAEVFDVLKLRSVKDVRDLADKGYFTIGDDKIFDVAYSLADVLLLCVAEHETSILERSSRDNFMNQIKDVLAPRIGHGDTQDSSEITQSTSGSIHSPDLDPTPPTPSSNPITSHTSTSAPSTNSSTHQSNNSSLQPSIKPRPQPGLTPIPKSERREAPTQTKQSTPSSGVLLSSTSSQRLPHIIHKPSIISSNHVQPSSAQKSTSNVPQTPSMRRGLEESLQRIAQVARNNVKEEPEQVEDIWRPAPDYTPFASASGTSSSNKNKNPPIKAENTPQTSSTVKKNKFA